MAKPRFWLVKSEPSVYPYAQLEKEKRTEWTGVRNFEARNNLRSMAPGDLLLYYHSNEGKEIVGLAKVVSEPQVDSTATEGDWASVWVAPVSPLNRPVTLAEIKKTPELADLQLITRSRLSVVPVSGPHFRKILAMGKTKLPTR